MIKDIVKDKYVLSKKCVFSENYETDLKDLLDTAYHNSTKCVGLAANQIDSNNRIIVVKIDNKFVPMINPKFVRKYKTYGFKTKKEACLTFPGIITKKRRYKKIKISYIDTNNVLNTKTLINQTARIFQHELDHLNGILI